MQAFLSMYTGKSDVCGTTSPLVSDDAGIDDDENDGDEDKNDDDRLLPRVGG